MTVSLALGISGCASIYTVLLILPSATSILTPNGTFPSYGMQQYQNNTNSVKDKLEHKKESNHGSLRLVQVIFRHGDRSPLQSFPTDSNKDKWLQGYGQLTKLGWIQSFELGQLLGNRYRRFLGPLYKPDEVYIRSTDKDRSLMTAYGVGAGLFPKQSGSNKRWPFVQWQHVPVHTVSQKLDRMLSPAKACDYVRDLKYGLKAYFYSKQSLMKDKVTMFALSEYSGLEMNFTTLHYLADTLFCQKIHNMSRPKWLGKVMEDRLMSFYNHLPVLVPEESKYLAGILLETMINNMLNKVHNNKDKHKLYLYSAHQGNLHTLLSLLGAFQKEMTIPFASAIILELHSINHKLFVKLLYKSGDELVPQNLHISGCKKDLCPLSVLKDLFDEPAQKSWEDVCGNASQESVIDFGENTIPILVAVLVVFIGLDFFLLYKTFMYRKRLHGGGRKEVYSLVRTDGGSSSDESDSNDSTDVVDVLPKDNGHRTPSNGTLSRGKKMNGTKGKGKRYGLKTKNRSDNNDDYYEEMALFVAPSRTPK